MKKVAKREMPTLHEYIAENLPDGLVVGEYGTDGYTSYFGFFRKRWLSKRFVAKTTIPHTTLEIYDASEEHVFAKIMRDYESEYGLKTKMVTDYE